MAKRVDPGLKSRRDQAVVAMSFSRSDTSTLAGKILDLMAQVRATVGEGHPAGDRLMWDLTGCLEALRRANSLLLEAVDAAHGIDVTIEVPDLELWDEQYTRS